MTNIDEVLSFVKSHPGCTSRDVYNGTGITPIQQINQILGKLVKKGSLDRKWYEGVYRYHIKASSTKTGDSSVPSGHSGEQQEAERWLVCELSKKIGVELRKERIYLEGRSWVELDGFCESPLVLCEAWAHIGPLKSAQKNKVMADAFKLLFVNNTCFKGTGKCILVFSDNEAASHFQGKSWMAQCLNRHNIIVEVIELPTEIRTRVQMAQKRQRR